MRVRINGDYYFNISKDRSRRSGKLVCPPYRTFILKSYKVVKCPNCDFLFYAKSKQKTGACPRFAYVIDVEAYMQEVYGCRKRALYIDFDDITIEALLPMSPMVAINGA